MSIVLESYKVLFDMYQSVSDRIKHIVEVQRETWAMSRLIGAYKANRRINKREFRHLIKQVISNANSNVVKFLFLDVAVDASIEKLAFRMINS